MLTENTTRREYLDYMAMSEDANRAVARHREKVEAMADADWPAHRAKLLNIGERSASATRRMARKVFGRVR